MQPENTLTYSYKQGIERTKEILKEDLVIEFLEEFSPYKYSDMIRDNIISKNVETAYRLLNCKLLYGCKLRELHEDKGIVFLPPEYARWLTPLCVVYSYLGENMQAFNIPQIERLAATIKTMVNEVNKYIQGDKSDADALDFKTDSEVLDFIFNQKDNRNDIERNEDD